MLREIKKIRQVRGEPKRRWFFSKQLDLVVWESPDGTLLGFQLAYDKDRREHSFSWHLLRGFSHYRVDDGESIAGVNNTPLLYNQGNFNAERIRVLFHDAIGEVPTHIAKLVDDKISEYARILLTAR